MILKDLGGTALKALRRGMELVDQQAEETDLWAWTTAEDLVTKLSRSYVVIDSVGVGRGDVELVQQGDNTPVSDFLTEFN